MKPQDKIEQNKHTEVEQVHLEELFQVESQLYRLEQRRKELLVVLQTLEVLNEQKEKQNGPV